jgi:hypothetical protein
MPRRKSAAIMGTEGSGIKKTEQIEFFTRRLLVSRCFVSVIYRRICNNMRSSNQFMHGYLKVRRNTYGIGWVIHF